MLRLPTKKERLIQILNILIRLSGLWGCIMVAIFLSHKTTPLYNFPILAYMVYHVYVLIFRNKSSVGRYFNGLFGMLPVAYSFYMLNLSQIDRYFSTIFIVVYIPIICFIHVPIVNVLIRPHTTKYKIKNGKEFEIFRFPTFHRHSSSVSDVSIKHNMNKSKVTRKHKKRQK